jgi:hypothetical protein
MGRVQRLELFTNQFIDGTQSSKEMTLTLRGRTIQLGVSLSNWEEGIGITSILKRARKKSGEKWSSRQP